MGLIVLGLWTGASAGEVEPRIDIGHVLVYYFDAAADYSVCAGSDCARLNMFNNAHRRCTNSRSSQP